jgi:conjugal transfer pilus assembly protein TraB
MQTELPTEAPQAPSGGRALWLVGTGVMLVLILVWLLPAQWTQAAGDEPAAQGGGTGAPVDAPPNFGSATPTDRFVQSFQQQVTQQLQSAIQQSSQAQEARLLEFEKQQEELGQQVQALQQTLGSAASGASGTPSADERAWQQPQVNVRRPVAPDAREAQSGPAALLPGALGGWWGGARGSASGAEAASPGAGAPDAARIAQTAFDPNLPAGAPPSASRSGRPGDPNIAPHGFIEGRLLNGVVAVVGGPERESIVALAGNYQSANGFVDDLDGCFALVQGKPEIAAGRIDFKLSRLTCNFPDGASRTWDTAGWLVDADGIRGVRATIVENASRKAAVAAAGGALGAVGMRLSQEQYQTNAFSGGAGSIAPGVSGTTSTFMGSTAGDVLGGAATGAANALSQSISDYYNLYSPSLQVGGGTPVTVVLANDLRVPPSGRGLTQTHTANP